MSDAEARSGAAEDADGDDPGDPVGGVELGDALPEVVVRAIRRRLAERRMSQKHLARRLGMTETTVSRWLHRQQGVPLGQLVRIADVLGVPLPELFTGQIGPIDDAQLMTERLLHLLADRMEAQTREYQALRATLRAVPLYRVGTRGDPRRGEGDPQAARATSFAHRPPGTEQTVGPRGFAVVVEGDELAGRGVRAGDVVFCNPDAPWGDSSLVAAGLGSGGPDDPRGAGPLALRELVYGPTRALDARTAPEAGPPETHPAGAYVAYGPVVVVLSLVLLQEGRGHAEDVRRRGPGPTPEERGGTPVQFHTDGNPGHRDREADGAVRVAP